MLKRIVLYIDTVKFIAYGYHIKNTSPRTLIIKTKIRGQLSACDRSAIKTVTADDKVYDVRFQGMFTSDHEEWYFDILDQMETDRLVSHSPVGTGGLPPLFPRPHPPQKGSVAK